MKIHGKSAEPSVQLRVCWWDGFKVDVPPKLSRAMKVLRIEQMLRRYGSDENLRRFYMNAYGAVKGNGGGNAV